MGGLAGDSWQSAALTLSSSAKISGKWLKHVGGADASEWPVPTWEELGCTNESHSRCTTTLKVGACRSPETKRLALAKCLHARLAGNSPLTELAMDIVWKVGELIRNYVSFDSADGSCAIAEHGELAVAVKGPSSGCVRTSTPMTPGSGKHTIKLELLTLSRQPEGGWCRQANCSPYSAVVGVMTAGQEYQYGWPHGYGVNTRNGVVINGGRQSRSLGSTSIERATKDPTRSCWVDSGDILRLTLDTCDER